LLGFAQQRDHLGVGDFREVRVPRAHRREPAGRPQAHEVIDEPGGGVGEIGRADRHGDHDARDAAGLQHPDRRTHGRAGGDAVVDEHHDPVRDGQRRPRPPVARRALSEHGLLAVDGPPQQLLADLGVADDRSVGDDDTTLADGAERQFRLGREADLADQQHIQRGGERGRDLRGDHDATAGKSQHDRLVRAERGQPIRKLTAS